MASAAPPTSLAPVSTPATTNSPSAPATPSPTPTPSSQAAPTTAPQTTAAPSSSSTPTNSSSGASSSAAASSSEGATSSSSTTKPSSSPSSSKPSLTSSVSFILQTSDGQVFTQTSIITVPASAPTGSQSSRSSSASFFHNTGAVAGVFSVVGIIGLVVIFILITSFVRRRRARKFDQEIDEAAAAAAAAQIPDFDDFDYTSGTGTGYAQYSETSHGTYNQPPLSHERSRNNLGDTPTSLDTHNNIGGPGAGAAGIGARGRSLRGGGMPDPFGALANPPEQYEMTESSRRSWNQGSLRGGAGTEVTTYDMLQAAGLSGSDPYAVTRAPSTRLANLPMQSGVSGLARSQSQGTSTLPTTAENYPMPTAVPAYPGGQDRPYPPEKARYSGSHRPAVDADVYGGYQDQPSASLDNPHSPGLPAPRAQDEQEDVADQYEPSPYPHAREEAARASLADDEDYGYSIGNRVLRVANE